MADKPVGFLDRLSRLTLKQAERLLGPRGPALIRQGGAYAIDVQEQVKLDARRLRLTLHDATVSLTPSAAKRGAIAWSCTRCTDACEHVGAAFALVLEEKTALGLALPPEPDMPLELLPEEALVPRAMEERMKRAAEEPMQVVPTDADCLWTDYLVTSQASGKTYRVALRGWDPGESYCTCPDFRTNTLGICKHILHVADKMKRRFPAAVRKAPFVQREIAVALSYRETVALRVLLPRELPAGAAGMEPYREGLVADIGGLVRALRVLEQSGVPFTVYPDAEEFIQQHLLREHLTRKMEAVRRDPAEHPWRRGLLRVELLPYQLDGIAFAVGAGRAILADDMGLGKTIQGIGVAEILAREAGISRVLVVCPVSLKAQWTSEIRRFCGREAQLVVGTAEERAAQIAGGTFFTICNYEQVLRDLQAIERVRWDLVILDEGQRIKNWESKTSRVVKGLRSPFALVLSGTPLENRLEELYTVVSFVDDRRLGPAFRFFHRHRIVDERGKVQGYKNLDALREALRPILLRRTRREVMTQLPPRSTEVIRIAPTDEQAGLHKAHHAIVNAVIRKSYISEMDLLRLQKALLMCRMAADGTYLVNKEAPGYSSKLERFDELIGELAAEEGRKVIVFSEWTTMLDLIEPILAKHAITHVRLDGSVPQKQRAQVVHGFTHDPGCMVFLATNAGATGLNLQAADTVINVDLPWNPAVLEQRIARAHRMGQKRPVQVYLLVTENTIEERLLYTLASKQKLADASLDAASDVDQVELESGMEELRRRLEVLLGQEPPAPVDESEKRRLEEEAGKAAAERREKIAAAGGQLLTAAFAFLGELLPAAPPSPRRQQTVEAMQANLAQCLTTGDDGLLRLTVTLPNAEAVAQLAAAMARLADLQVAEDKTPA